MFAILDYFSAKNFFNLSQILDVKSNTKSFIKFIDFFLFFNKNNNIINIYKKFNIFVKMHK